MGSRGILLACALALVVAAGIALTYWADGLGEPSPVGEYYYNLVEFRSEDGVMEHCDHFGTMVFDRGDKATIRGTRRCNGGETVTATGDFSYRVEDGTIELREAGSGEVDRARILDGGRILLLDGTSRTPGSVVHVLHGVAVKL